MAFNNLYTFLLYLNRTYYLWICSYSMLMAVSSCLVITMESLDEGEEKMYKDSNLPLAPGECDSANRSDSDVENEHNKHSEDNLLRVVHEQTLGKNFYSELSTFHELKFGTLVVKEYIHDSIRGHEIWDMNIVEDKGNEVRKHDHANTVKYFGMDLIPPKRDLLVFMEYMDISLMDIIDCYHHSKKKKRNNIENFIWHIVKPIMMALKHLHVIKCPCEDLKVSDVFLNKQGIVKIRSFDGCPFPPLKKILHGARNVYIAPERLNEDYYAKWGISSDIWSLGLILYELATGIIPYKNNGAKNVEEVKKIVRDAPFPLTYGGSKVSEELRNLINECMELESDNRPCAAKLLHYGDTTQSKFDPVMFIKQYIHDGKRYYPDEVICREIHR